MPDRRAEPRREFDLQPHPRILPMLGEINLKQWQCIGELVDNSVDGFISANRERRAISDPEVHVTLPTRVARDAHVTVLDNGPGMDPDKLENAVRAGWTGNDPVNYLGMFGMGFNIATARLGTLTRVWSTREGDRVWHGLEIDFDSLLRQRHFRTPVLTRPKTNPAVHGTEISIERLKPEQGQWFAGAANRSKLRDQLERVYAAMLRREGTPLTIRLLMNGTALRGRQHCVWGGPGNADRIVHHARFGDIGAYQTVNVGLPDRKFCGRCWQWLRADEDVCPACESAENVVVRERRVRGWLGLQRYYDENEYGIDFVRHGRKIEIASLDLFQWDNNQGGREREYPIDDPRHRGRIVGEIHLDHCRVHYTKDQFDRNDPAWAEMVRIVRGDGPLRPQEASQLGFGDNDSPLFRLFQAFRRNSPKPKVAGCYANLLLVPDNDRAREMTERFYASDPLYLPDTKWWELVEEADRALLLGEGGPGGGGGGPFPGGAPPGEPVPGTAPAPAPAAPPRVPVPSLTREYRDDTTDQRWNVTAYSVQHDDPALASGANPWRLVRTTAGTYEFLINTDHPVFGSATMTRLDALLAELAWSAMDFLRGQRTDVTFASVLTALRERYATTTKLDPVTLTAEAAAALRNLARAVSRNIEPGDAEALYQELSMAERSTVLARVHGVAGGEAARIIGEGRFLEYAPKETLLGFFERNPEYFFDGLYWDDAYETLDLGDAQATEEARARVVRRYLSLLVDAVWLAENDPDDLARVGRARLLRGALALELLASDQVRGTDA